MTTPVFELKGVSAGYGDVQILNDVSIQVPANSIVTIVGPNGAGKSTILKSIYGIAKVTAGEIKLHKLSGESIDVRATKPHHLADIGIAYVHWQSGKRSCTSNTRTWSFARKTAPEPSLADNDKCWLWPAR